jgi:DNA-binding NarL/FixJ family response regulator
LYQGVVDTLVSSALGGKTSPGCTTPNPVDLNAAWRSRPTPADDPQPRAALERSRAVVGQKASLQPLRARRLAQPREREVMALVVSGLLNKQVAGELVSEITVRAHRGRVMGKWRRARWPSW